LQLAGEGGLRAQLTKRLVKSALEGEITDHLGYDRHDTTGRDGGNSRNGHRAKTVLNEVGPMPTPGHDTLVGTDNHTTMVNGLGVLGWA